MRCSNPPPLEIDRRLTLAHLNAAFATAYSDLLPEIFETPVRRCMTGELIAGKVFAVNASAPRDLRFPGGER